MSALNQKFGIIVGTDHHSFPSAVANCVSAGISTIFHHRGTTKVYFHFGNTEATRPPAQWGCLDASKLDKNSWSHRSGDLASLVQALPARYTVADCCFAEIPNSFDDSQPELRDEFRLYLGNTEALRVVFVPFGSAGIWRITGREIRGRFWGGNFKTMQLPGPTPGGASKYEQTLVISPGDSRQHNFCAVDVLAGTVSWLTCE
jgi:hypothetical protein